MSEANARLASSKIAYTHNQSVKREDGTEYQKGVQVHIGFFPDERRIEMSTDGVNLEVFLDEPTDFNTTPYWRVYSTHWSNFAAYGDESNSNQAYNREAWVKIARDTPEYGSKAMERDCVIVHDLMSILFQYVGKNATRNNYDDEKRISHLLYGVKRKPAIYETCYQRPLKSKGSFGWKHF